MKEKICGIYKIENDIDHKIYIGQSHDCTIRWVHHKYAAVRGDKCPLYDDMRTMGIEHFHFEILEECEDKDLCDLEKLYISLFNSYNDGYNQTRGGEKSPYGENNPMYGKPAWNRGKLHTEETRKKMSDAQKGKKFSEKHKHRLSKSHKGKPSPNKGKPSTIKGKHRVWNEDHTKFHMEW